jgi:hypothetical protein
VADAKISTVLPLIEGIFEIRHPSGALDLLEAFVG